MLNFFSLTVGFVFVDYFEFAGAVDSASPVDPATYEKALSSLTSSDLDL